MDATSLDDWSVDVTLFEHAVFQVKLAQQSSKLDAILWQGEGDCSKGNYKLYKEKFLKIVEAFRRELGTPDIPIIIGGIVII
ncbi:sialate O-acetylesterase [Metaclostridioides mangenotii]|uniref:sialate O-acetylesterase n=1 Tax=Metaclostridioides mangenotii TaxID=1540 RepID=UPI0009DCF2CB